VSIGSNNYRQLKTANEWTRQPYGRSVPYALWNL